MFDGKLFGEAVVGQVKTFVDRAISPILDRLKAVEDRPLSIDGKDGQPGRDGLPGVPGRDGADGKDGANGERGAAGFSLTDFDVKLADDGRTIELSFESGDTRFTRELALPTMIYRGAYVEAQTYERGDTVTWGGSLWHCNGGEPEGEWSGATKEKPGEGSKAWTLAAKRGRDGKDGRGEKGDPGEAGRDGRDLTQIGPDGSKW